MVTFPRFIVTITVKYAGAPVADAAADGKGHAINQQRIVLEDFYVSLISRRPDRRRFQR